MKPHKYIAFATVLILIAFVSFNNFSFCQTGYSHKFIPQNGPFNSTAHFLNAPDSLNDANTKEAISVNYSSGKSDKLAAIYCIVTKPNTVYNRTMVITDRMHKSSLTKISYASVNGKSFIMSKLVSNGNTNFFINFTVAMNGTNYYINNQWKPSNSISSTTNDIINFQVSSLTEQATIELAQNILAMISSVGNLIYTFDNPLMPEVFVTSGFYQDGNFYLNLNNPARANTFYIKGSYANAINDVTKTFNYMIVLDSSNVDQLIIPLEQFYYAEFTITTNSTQGYDYICYSSNNNTNESNKTPQVLGINNISSSAVINSIANYPNPFIASTNFKVDLNRTSDIRIDIYDMTGKIISNVADGKFTAGVHTITYADEHLSSGIYLCRITSGSFVKTMKLIKK